MNWNLTDISLCQLRGVTRELERRCRMDGVSDMYAFIKYLSLHGPNTLLARVEPSVRVFQEARRIGMTDVIVNSFPSGVRSRVIADRYEKAVFFDIETDGCGTHARITSIATIMNGEEQVFVRGVDLADFLSVWNAAEVIVSFNGKRFDVPMLMREFGLSRIPAHVDLMDEARCYGLRGGLKEIEKQIGFVRHESSCQNGLDAIGMWRKYCEEYDSSLLEDLKCYNLDDVRALIALYRHILPLSTEELI